MQTDTHLMEDAISVSSDSRANSPGLSRRAILTPAIQNIVGALGGVEQVSPTESLYVLGDSCLGCLKDLKKLWRKDDTDDERTVARILWETRVLQRDLVPILLETAGKGKVEDKCALACADLITAMTWPIDVAEELKELDDEIDQTTDYSTLLEAHRSYKAAMLRPDVILALFSIALPALAKGKRERTERDGQIINLVLHCLRNLAFIKDPPPNAHASGEQAEYASLQSKLINTFKDTAILDSLLTFASNSDDPMFNPWNNLILEIMYLLFRGVKPSSLILDQQTKAKQDLRNLLDAEAKVKRDGGKSRPTRHSRFGTTISVKSDIRMERPKITEKDNVRLLFVAQWFLEFFLAIRTHEGEATWNFLIVKQVVEEEWVKWVLRRLRDAESEKPKQWRELQAGMDCLAQLLLLIEVMASSDGIYAEAANTLQHKLYYNGEILELAFENLRGFKHNAGQKSIAYLESAVHLSYVLLRVLEKWAKGKGNSMVIRKKKKAKKAKGVTEEEGIVDVPSDGEGEVAEEEFKDSMVTFDAYEFKFANPDVNATLLQYLGRYAEFDTAEKMKRVVNLLHRQAIKVKADALFFKVTTLELFGRLIKEEKTLPKDQPYLDLMQLVKFVLRKFFKGVEESPFLLVEAFFPKASSRKKMAFKANRDEESSSDHDRTAKGVASNKRPEVFVKKGFSWSEEMGIAIACLVDEGQLDLIDWAKEILMFVIGQRLRIIAETDAAPDNDDQGSDEGDDAAIISKQAGMPSAAARSRIEDYAIPYTTQDKADAATKNANLKLLFRLLKFSTRDDEADELEWYIPATTMPDELQRSLVVIDQFIKEPLDLKGKKAADLLSKRRARRTTRRRRRRHASDGSSDEVDLSDMENPSRKAKRTRKAKEQETYKSAQFIEDSDAALTDDDKFFAREQEIRDKAQAAADAGIVAPTNMAPTGTKKRKKKASTGPVKKFKTLVADRPERNMATPKIASDSPPLAPDDDDEDSDAPRREASSQRKSRHRRPSHRQSGEEASLAGQESDANSTDGNASKAPPPKPRPRPRPKMRFGGGANATADAPIPSTSSPGPASSSPARSWQSTPPPDDEGSDQVLVSRQRPPRKKNLIESDDE
ncbi:Topoisomerase 1-associated factor 1 [Tulasnella sp. 403]|nr:Topoisomerase 1-associated factor 1 [Tulasnella sp. 403]